MNEEERVALIRNAKEPEEKAEHKELEEKTVICVE
jgi:hypothetical protein